MRLFLAQAQDRYVTKFSGPDDGDGGEGGEGGKDEGGEFKLSGKFIEKIDPQTKKSIKIPIEFDSVLGHFISKTRDEVEKKYKPILEQFDNEKADYATVKAEYDKLKEASMTMEEKAQNNAKKAIVEVEKKMQATAEERDRFKDLFFSSTIRNDIFASFSGTNLCNAEQTLICFREEGRAHPEELVDSEGKPTNRFGTKLTLMLEDDKGNPVEVEGSPTELFKRWIGLDRNLHHVQNDTNPGGGSRPGTQTKGKVDYSKMSPKERLDAARQAQS